MNSETETNKNIVRALYDAIDRADREAAFALLHPEYEMSMQGTGRQLDAEGYWSLIETIRTALNGLIHLSDVMIAEGDRVSTRGMVIATHIGPLYGVAATGRTVQTPYLNMVRIKDGKVIEMVALMDTQLLELQIRSGEAS